jgi:hypothetical protein
LSKAFTVFSPPPSLSAAPNCVRLSESVTTKGGFVPRTVLVHLNVEAPESDTRTADQIADALMGALEVGADDDSVRELSVTAPLAEEI